MNWYIKEFSQLTKVSVRTLHHYDDLGLLKPSVRLSNGYRLYSQDDLLKLERIVALKFFGFSLKQIMVLVRNDESVIDHLKGQKECLEQQIKNLHHATEIIDQLVQDSSANKPVDWSKIAQLLEVYKMTQDLKKSWVGKIFSEDQLAQFAQLQKRHTEQEMNEYGKQWDILVAKVTANLDKDPHSPIGQQLAKEWMGWLDKVYGNYPELKDALSLAYKYNKIPDMPFDAKLWDFIEKAVTFMHNNKKS